MAISDERLKRLERLEELLEKGNIKIVVENKDSSGDTKEVDKEVKEVKTDVKKLTKKKVKVSKIPFDDSIDIGILTPVLIIGIVTGVLTGLSILGLFFIILLPIFGVILMRLFPLYLGVRGGMKKAFASCIATGIFAAVISTIILLILEIFLASSIYEFVKPFVDFLDPTMLSILLGSVGLDTTVSFVGLLTRFIISVILYPILLLLGALVYLKFKW